MGLLSHSTCLFKSFVSLCIFFPANLIQQNSYLAILIKSHDNNSRTIAPDELGLFLKFLLPFLEADGVHNTLALCTLQPCFYYREFGGVNTEWYLKKNEF